LVRRIGSLRAIEASTMRFSRVSSAMVENVPAGIASSGHATSRRLSGAIGAPKRSGAVAITMVRVGTACCFGAIVLRLSSA
jgi:hypothetical protein